MAQAKKNPDGLSVHAILAKLRTEQRQAAVEAAYTRCVGDSSRYATPLSVLAWIAHDAACLREMDEAAFISAVGHLQTVDANSEAVAAAFQAIASQGRITCSAFIKAQMVCACAALWYA